MTTKVPRLLRVHEVAELTGLQRWRIYQLLAANEGPPSLRIGKTLWIPEDQLARWIEEQTAKEQKPNGLGND